MPDDPKPTLLTPKVRYRTVDIRDRGYLPHWEQDAATYFITFRLADSLPAGVGRVSARSAHEELDRALGCCHLRDARVAAAVQESIHFLDDKSYRLLAWCVMPNHVHLVFRLLPGFQLSRVMHSLKSFTANRANRLLGRHGRFWQREYYDRLIRNEEELDRALRYVIHNPKKAGLENWPWAGVSVD